MEALFSFLIVAILATIAYYTFKVSLLVLRALWQLGDPRPGRARPRSGSGTRTHAASRNLDDDIDGMNPGDYYNGPGGYDATGGYLDRR